MTLTFFDLDFIIVSKGQKVKSQKRSKTTFCVAKSAIIFDLLLFSRFFVDFQICKIPCHKKYRFYFCSLCRIILHLILIYVIIRKVVIMKKSNSAAGILLSLISGIFWGFSGSCGQYLFTYHGVSSKWLVPVRMIATGLILLTVCIIKNKKKIFVVWKSKENAFRLIAFTVFGLILCQYAYFTAIEHSNAGTATVLQYLSPAMILVFMCLKNKKLPALAEVIAIILAVGGTFLIATGGNFSSFSITPAALIWGLLSAVFLVCYSLIPVKLLKITDTPTVLGWGMLAGGIVITLIFAPWKIMPVINLPLIGAVAGIVILGTVIAYSFFLEGIRLIGATKASIISSIEPVAATVISAVWLGTDFSRADIIGFIMIISTVIIISLFNKKEHTEN